MNLHTIKIDLPSHIDAVVFDLDGVVRHWDNSELYKFEQENFLEKGFLFKFAFDKDLLRKVVTGVISHEEWIELVYKSLLSDISDKLAIELIDIWNKSKFRINEELLNQIKSKYPSAYFYLLTNATSRLENDLKGTRVLNCFDKIFNTSKIGLAKPDEAIFTYVLNDIKIPPRSCLFIDDFAINCEAAAKLGFNVVLFTNL